MESYVYIYVKEIFACRDIPRIKHNHTEASFFNFSGHRISGLISDRKRSQIRQFSSDVARLPSDVSHGLRSKIILNIPHIFNTCNEYSPFS